MPACTGARDEATITGWTNEQGVHQRFARVPALGGDEAVAGDDRARHTTIAPTLETGVIGRPDDTSGGRAVMQRIWLAALGLVVWQLGSMTFGFNEFMFDHPPRLPGIIAALVTAVAWIALAAWGGYHRRGRFGIAVATLWAATVAVLVGTMWMKTLESDVYVTPWHGADLLLLIAAGGPLYSLGSLVPLDDSLLGTTIVAAVILVFVVVAFLIARWIGISRSVRRQGPLQPAVPVR